MPLLDHFREPMHREYRWESFYSNWATRIADGLCSQVPADFLVGEHIHSGARFEIDIATCEEETSYAPPAPTWRIPGTIPDSFEVRVFSTFGGKTLVAVIELATPRHKDRLSERRDFTAKCMTYLRRGVSLIVMDIVTVRRVNLHNEMMRLMDLPPEFYFPDSVAIYSAAYRPVRRAEKDEIDVWTQPLVVGEVLPTLPLRLTGDLFVPVDFEAAYMEACRRRRLI